MKTISSPMHYCRGLCVSSALALFIATTGLSLSLSMPEKAQAQSSDTRTLATGSRLPLSPSAPDRYTVKSGDTLWGISKLFLEQPWYWPELWYLNPQIQNPHLIYPGDTLALVNVNGQTRLTISERGEVGSAETVTRGNGVRLSPQVRSEPLSQAITAIPYNVIAAFMGRPSILTLDEVKSAPHIVSLRDRHVLGAAGDEFYAVGLGAAPEGARYNVVHVEEALRDPETKKTLGYRGIYVGNGPVLTSGTPTKLRLTESALEALPGDKLFAELYALNMDFVPHAPTNSVRGVIFAVNGVSVVGQYQVVAINRGGKHGLEAGNVLDIYQGGEVIRDRYTDGRSANAMETPSGTFAKKVRLPAERVGTVMVFKAYDNMSYGLIMESTNTVRIGDEIRNP